VVRIQVIEQSKLSVLPSLVGMIDQNPDFTRVASAVQNRCNLLLMKVHKHLSRLAKSVHQSACFGAIAEPLRGM
jgi:hypothetical protein